MSDLQFTVEDNDPADGSGGGARIIAPHETPMPGEMNHLPSNATQSVPNEKSTLEYIREQLNSSSHPTVVIFHVLFKGLAIFFYVFGGWFMPTSKAGSSGGSFITLTVIIILLLAADFWVVKNVTGRLLVGLRWWNKVDEDSTTWIFESAEQSENPKPINNFDKSVFWTVLYATPFVWIGMLLLAVLKFEINWLLVCIMALALGCSNVYGYYKCSSDQKARFERLVTQGTQEGIMSVATSGIMSVLPILTGRSDTSRTMA